MILGIFIGGSEKMKRLLVVTLLLLGISAFVSCNSYDVEGKPEIASNPAKMVFAYYPWDDGNNTTEPTAEPTEEPTEEPTTEPTDEPTTEPTETDEDVEPDEDIDPTTPDEDDAESDEDVDGEPGAVIEEDAPVYVKTVRAEVADVITKEFEIYNRGVTGELKIRKINMIDPNGELIANLGDPNYKKLFQLEVQKMENGIAAEGYNAKGLTFDYLGENKDDSIASLCPLQLDSADKVCKKGFDPKKYNSKFKIRISYDKAAATYLKDNPIEGYRLNGDFSIEICTNDPTKGKTDTCGESSTSYRIQITRQPNKPPKPIIHVAFRTPITEPMSYRNIYDKVDMDLSKTCVSDPDHPDKCLANWEERYYIKYKWEMKESPTPLLDDSKLKLSEMDAAAGQWLPDDGKRGNPKRASFTGLMITPRRYPGEENKNKDFDAAKCASECGNEPVYDKNNPDEFLFLKLSDYLICRQKYCEEQRTKYYKISIQAETVDKETDLVSDTADITVVPKIIPQARVVAQLSYKQGFRTKAESESKEGTIVDVDIHMIKKSSLEAGSYNFTPTEGLLGTKARNVDCALGTIDPSTNKDECEAYWRHDDCSFGDNGLDGVDEGLTIQWHASLDIDNTWGGNNYETPETIGLGPITDANGDGVPDVPVIDDEYLLVIGYVSCVSNYSDGAGDRCDSAYTGEDKAYTVDARVEILVDGDEAPRKASSDGKRPADNYSATDFKINVNEWKVIAVVKWDNSLPSPESNKSYPGNAIVTDVKMEDQGIEIDPVNHPVCSYDNSDAVLIPIWNAETYKAYIETPNEEGSKLGTCL